MHRSGGGKNYLNRMRSRWRAQILSIEIAHAVMSNNHSCTCTACAHALGAQLSTRLAIRSEAAIRQRRGSLLRFERGDREQQTLLTGTCHCGASTWSLEGDPGRVTACNCTLCRRYGTLWAYDYEGERIRVSGRTSVYTRPGKTNPSLEIHFCPTCGCVLCWRGLRVEADGRRRMAVNVRLAPPEAVADLAIDHFDGLETFDDLPSDGRCVRDLWF